MLYRKLFDQCQNAKAGRWRGTLDAFSHYELAGKTVGIIGMGRIGREVARHLKLWHVNLLYYDVYMSPLK